MLAARSSRLAVFLVVVSGFALLAALALSQATPPGPRIDAPGADHFSVSAADSANGPIDVGHGVLVGADQKHDRSKTLKDMPRKPPRALPAEDEEGEQESRGERESPHAVDTVVQSTAAAPAMPSAGLNFDGVAFPGVSCFCAPPDTNGEVGATQYVQIVNDGYQVFSKTTGASVYGPASVASIWQGFGGVCETNGDGDPVVLYDQLANRWLVSQFAGSPIPNHECVAISTSSDATSSYNRYDFNLGSNFMDYPHGGVWPDGYYFSFNVFNSSGTLYLGPQPVVFDRVKMLAGQTATFQTRSPLGSLTDPFLPADLDGSAPPPAGAPASFVKWPGNGTYQTYHYDVDWTTPTNSTFTSFASPAAAGFTELCPTTRSCVPQQGSTSNLDGIGDRLMFRLAYRNFGDHESVVGNLSVSSGGVAGIRWFELRNVTNGPETVFQQSTYQPDTTWRWMGSAAMDKNGDIAIGYSASSSSMFPQLRYSGRLASDPINSLAQGEATLFAGTGSQTGTSNRWGDYADLTIDPVDDCTFWFTSEYYSSTTSFNWRTRIGAFSFPSCSGGGPTTGTITGEVRDASTNAAISGATVSYSGGTTTTDATGTYTLASVTPGTYSVSASKSGYVTGTNTGVAVTAGNTTTSNFSLNPVPPTTGSITGHVTNSVTQAAISGATVTLSTGPSTTTDAAGAYTFSSLAPANYDVTASKSGYVSATNTGVAVTAGNATTSDFALNPVPVTTTPYAYASGSAAGTGGDGNGYEGTRANLLGAPDGVLATDGSSGTANSTSCTSTARDSEVTTGHALGTLGSSILGIQVQVRGRVNTANKSPRFCVQLSSDGGATWTVGKLTSNLTTSLATYTVGSTSDLWGRAWTAADFGSSFRVRVIDLANATSKTFSLDSVGVAVTYQ
jgi:hypothetical protein